MERCGWAQEQPDFYLAYHDDEWGMPIPNRSDANWFEMLTLEGAQAGLSWRTILAKRDGYRRAFLGFDPERVAAMDDADLAKLTTDTGIVRNRLKIASTRANAQAALEIIMEMGSLDAYFWSHLDYQPIQNAWTSMAEVPAETVEAKALSKDLKKRGFRFVGPTIIYALMQDTGMVNDHIVSCFRHGPCRDAAALIRAPGS